MATTYNVYRDGEKVKSGLESKKFTDTGLTPNTEYSYQVSAENSAGESEKSDTVKATTDYSAVESVSISPKTNNLEVGGTRKLNATVEPSTAKQNVTFSSSDDAVATVDSNGNVEAIAEGEATITVTAEGKTDTATVNITVPVVNVESVEISPKSVDLEVGETQQLESTVIPSGADDKGVSYSSSEGDVATVNSSGLVTAVSEGETTITVTTDDGDKTDTSTINVTEPEPEEPDPEE